MTISREDRLLLVHSSPHFPLFGNQIADDDDDVHFFARVYFWAAAKKNVCQCLLLKLLILSYKHDSQVESVKMVTRPSSLGGGGKNEMTKAKTLQVLHSASLIITKRDPHHDHNHLVYETTDIAPDDDGDGCCELMIIISSSIMIANVTWASFSHTFLAGSFAKFLNLLPAEAPSSSLFTCLRLDMNSLSFHSLSLDSRLFFSFCLLLLIEVSKRKTREKGRRRRRRRRGWLIGFGMKDKTVPWREESKRTTIVFSNVGISARFGEEGNKNTGGSKKWETTCSLSLFSHGMRSGNIISLATRRMKQKEGEPKS